MLCHPSSRQNLRLRFSATRKIRQEVRSWKVLMSNIMKIEAQRGPWGLRFAVLGTGYWYLDFALLAMSESSKYLRILGHLMETICIP